MIRLRQSPCFPVLPLLVFLLGCASAASPARAAERLAAAGRMTAHTLLFQGHVGGQERLTVRPDGSVHVDFSYRDNGRGPDLREDFAFGADGTLARYTVAGSSTFGAPVAEQFERLPNGGARWKSLADAAPVEGAPAPAGAIYLPVENGNQYVAAVARQLLRHPGQPMASWTGGQLSARRLASARVHGAGPGGGVAVDLVALTGLELGPSYVWLRHGGMQAYFAHVDAGFAEIEQGFEPAAAALLVRQDEEDRRERARLAERLSHHYGDELVIRDVRVFDAEHAQLGAASDVYVSRGRIAVVLPAGSVRHGGDIAEIDGAGRTLLPGLFDMHVHDEPWSGLLHLAGGVTTGRDMGNDNAALRSLAKDIDAGINLGERVLAAGFIEGDSPFAARADFVVKSADEAMAAVDWYAQHGYRQVKLYNSIKPEWVQAIAAHAHALGLRVSGHVPAFMHAEDAVRAGFDEIQHINQVTLNFLTGPADDTRTLLRFELVARRANAIDLDSDVVDRFIALLREHDTAIDVTLACFEAPFTQLQGELSPSWASTADHLPPALRRRLRVNSTDVTPANVAASRASYATMLALTKKMFDAGVPLEAGTDDVPGFMLHRELELYVQAGITPAQALKIATWNGARFTRTLDRYGSVEPGKVADLVLVDGDPTANIADIERIAAVVKEGTVYFPAELYQAVGIRPFAAAPAVHVPPARRAVPALAGAPRRLGAHRDE